MNSRQIYHRTQLANGLRVVTAPRQETESVAVGIWINAGGRYENGRSNGISHFLEHLLFKGTRTRSSREIKTAIEGSGGVLNAFTEEEFTCVWAKVLPQNLRPAVEILTDMVRFSELDPEELEKERQVILEEIRMYRDLPMQSVHELLNTLLWPNHPLGMVLAGTEKSVKRIRRLDLRSYQKRFYTPRNICVAAAGLFNHRMLVDIITPLWAKVPPGRPSLYAKVHERQQKPRCKIESKETEQTHFCLGFHAFPRNHPQTQALNLLNIILGGNMSSRLFQKVREDKGLAYEIGSQVKRYRDTGFFSVSAGVEHRHLVRSLAVILQELKRVRHQLVTQREFDQAITFFISQILFALEDTVEQMCWIGECEMLLGRIQPVEEIVDQVKKLHRHDLKEVARKMIRSEHLSMAVIGPVKPKVSTRIPEMLTV